jgi:Tfp pilus assembly protein PilF
MRGKPVPNLPEGKNSEWYGVLGRKFSGEGRWILAEAAFETAWSLGNDSAEVWNNIGVARAQQGEWKTAGEAFERAILRDRNFAEAYKNYGFLLIQEGRRAKARRVLETGKEVAPGHEEILILLRQLDGPP